MVAVLVKGERKRDLFIAQGNLIPGISLVLKMKRNVELSSVEL